ncbi:MAG: efflux RND transporter permease subunit [Bacteroidota bacterium]|nr:efflux RND transporter permease subunit [Bacteroidota bacterium]
MLNNIITFSLKNRLLVLLCAALLTLGGAYIASEMEVDVFPDLTAPTVVVMTEAHGMAPEEVERLVSFPIETAVNGATNVRRVRSSSSAGFSIVWVEFNWDTDIFKARQIVSEKLITIGEGLPVGVGSPTLAPQSSIMGEILLIGLTSDSTSQMDLRTIAEWTIRPALLATGGVSQVTTIGGDFKQYQILLNPSKMNFYKVSLTDIMETCNGMNNNATGGVMYEYSNEYIIRGLARTSDISEIGKSVVKVISEYPVKLEDVAEITIGAGPTLGYGSLNGKPAVILTVLKQPNTNTLVLTQKIDENIANLKKSLPSHINIDTNIFRQADFIESSIHNVQKALIEGSFFVIIVLLVFLMNFRTTIISLVAIPISLLISIIALKLFGYNINTMSLGGMAIAIGVLVDDAIIVVDNAYKRIKLNAKHAHHARIGYTEVIFKATKEIMGSILNATLIIIVAFIPLFFLSGMEGRMLQPLGIAFIVSLFASLIVAVSLTPVLSSYLLTSPKMLARNENGSPVVKWLGEKYESLLRLAMKAKKVILWGAGLMVVIAGFVFFTMGRSFLPEFNEGSLTIGTVSLPGISLEEANKIGALVEKTLMSVPEVNSVTRRQGRAELDEHALGVNGAEIDVTFTLGERPREEFMLDVRKKMAGISGVNITVGQPLGHRIDHMLSGTRANIAIKLFGADLGKLFTIANQIKSNVEGIEGLVDISVEQQIDIPQLQIKPKRDMLAKYGITINQFTEFVDVAFAGEKVSEVFEGNRSFDLVVRYDAANRGSMNNIRNALIDTKDGKKVPLYYVADVVSASGPNTINRENVQRKIVVSANVAGRDLESVVDDIKTKVNQNIQLPEGYRVEYGGQFESAEKASQMLLITSLIAILIIFLLLFQEFKDTTLAAIILLNLPLALIGGVFSLYFTSGIVSIPAIIGFITLFGIATRNGILLISNYQTLEHEGHGLLDTIITGSRERLSPILMTALTAALALIPLALSGNVAGNEIQSPMAKVILGGLLTSTLLNIFIVPIVYYLVSRNKHQFKTEKA